MRRWPGVRFHTVLNAPRLSVLRMLTTGVTSTAPPLSLLSWSVDATGHAHRQCNRRLTLSQRLPFLCRTIVEAAPDIVALQDSSTEVAEALCSPLAFSAENNDVRVEGPTAGRLQPVGRMDDHQYELLGTCRNGKCGQLQLFRRCDSLWNGRLLPNRPCLTAEFASNPTRYHGSLHFVLSNVDLTYRGKSLGVGGRPLVQPEVSVSGNPFTLRVGHENETTNQHSQSQRIKGHLDPNREMALNFVSRVSKPDVILGNFFMARGETMPGYEDAWVLAGAPAEHERTANTCAQHKLDAQTNYFYFVADEMPAALPQRSTEAEPQLTSSLFSASVGTRIPLFASGRLPNSENAGHDANEVEEKVDHSRRHLIPQIAGRFERCFFRCMPSRDHKREHPFVRRYGRRQFLVLKPFTEVQLTESGVMQSGGGSCHPVRCSVSDAYPILVLLS